MVAISKRLRLFRGVPDSKEELAKFRQQARDTLNKPYQFEAKPQVKSWDMSSSDPTHGFFKPFSQVDAPTVAPITSSSAKSYSALARVREEIASFEWRRLSLPVGVASFVLVSFALWQVFGTDTTLQGVIAQNSVASDTSNSAPMVTPVGEVVPPGTELEPGGPYSGTGSTQPSSGGSTNLNQGAPAPATSAPAPAPTCPTGLVCTGQALDGSACTTSNPCQIVQLTTPLATGGTIIETGKDSAGNSCSATNPCVLTH